jgi:hypothetical protein
MYAPATPDARKLAGDRGTQIAAAMPFRPEPFKLAAGLDSRPYRMCSFPLRFGDRDLSAGYVELQSRLRIAEDAANAVIGGVV